MKDTEEKIHKFLEENPFAHLSDLWRIFPDIPKGTLALSYSKWMDKMRRQQQKQLDEIMVQQNQTDDKPPQSEKQAQEPETANQGAEIEAQESHTANQGTEIETQEAQDLGSIPPEPKSTDVTPKPDMVSVQVEPEQTRIKEETPSAPPTAKETEPVAKEVEESDPQESAAKEKPKRKLPEAIAKNKPFFLYLLENKKALEGLIQMYQKDQKIVQKPAIKDIEITNTKKRTYEINQELYSQFTKVCKSLRITQKKAINLALLDFINQYRKG